MNEMIPTGGKMKSFQNDRGRARAPLRRQRSRRFRAGGARNAEQETGTQGPREGLDAQRDRWPSSRKVWPRVRDGRISPSASSSSSSSRPSRTTFIPSSSSRPRTAISATPRRPSGTGEMETTLNAFFQFYQPAEDRSAEADKMGGKMPTVLTTDGDGLQPR